MFAMNDTCENCSEVTMAALCRELLEETETQENIEQGVVSVALIENKLCKSKSSVVKKLKKAGLDLLAIAGENPKEKFDALRIYKLFYRIEKGSNEGSAIKLTTILQQPNSNIFDLDNEQISKYREAFESVYHEVRERVDNANLLERCLQEINSRWMQMIQSIFQLIYRRSIQAEFPAVLATLSRLDQWLSDFYGGRNEIRVFENSADAICENNRVMTCTFLFLLCYRLVAEIEGRLSTQGRCQELPNDVQDKPMEAMMNTAGADTLIQRGNVTVPWEKVKLLQNAAAEFQKNPYNQEAFRVIASYFQPLALVEELCTVIEYSFYGETRKGCLWDMLALDKNFFQDSFQWIFNILQQSAEKHQLNYKEGVPEVVLLAAHQIIYQIYQGEEKYYIQYNGNKHSEKSLMSALKREKPLDEVALREWDSRVANKILALLGRGEAIRPLRNIETTLLEIEKQILSSGSITTIWENHEKVFDKVTKHCEEQFPDIWCEKEHFFPF